MKPIIRKMARGALACFFIALPYGAAAVEPEIQPAQAVEHKDEGKRLEVLTNDSVVSMIKLGLPEGLIIVKIKASANEFNTSPDALLDLMKNGVNMTIITLMIEESAHPSKKAPPPSSESGEMPKPEPPKYIADVSHKVGDMVLIEGGCYDMGDSFGDGGNDEVPVHEVCVGDFNIGRFEVTVGEFRDFMKEKGHATEASRGDGCYIHNGKKWNKDPRKDWNDPGFPQAENYPVTCVSWNDVIGFIKWRSVKDGRMYRLPTEAELEYVARNGGKGVKFSWGGAEPKGNIADLSIREIFLDWNIWDGYDDGFVYTSPVGTYEPNEFGVYDLTGNVWEWTADWYDPAYYGSSAKDNPKGPENGGSKVLRGGSWFDPPYGVRATYRSWNVPGLRNFMNGFRLASSVE